MTSDSESRKGAFQDAGRFFAPGHLIQQRSQITSPPHKQRTNKESSMNVQPSVQLQRMLNSKNHGGLDIVIKIERVEDLQSNCNDDDEEDYTEHCFSMSCNVCTQSTDDQDCYFDLSLELPDRVVDISNLVPPDERSIDQVKRRISELVANPRRSSSASPLRPSFEDNMPSPIDEKLYPPAVTIKQIPDFEVDTIFLQGKMYVSRARREELKNREFAMLHQRQHVDREDSNRSKERQPLMEREAKQHRNSSLERARAATAAPLGLQNSVDRDAPIQRSSVERRNNAAAALNRQDSYRSHNSTSTATTRSSERKPAARCEESLRNLQSGGSSGKILEMDRSLNGRAAPVERSGGITRQESFHTLQRDASFRRQTSRPKLSKENSLNRRASDGGNIVSSTNGRQESFRNLMMKENSFRRASTGDRSEFVRQNSMGRRAATTGDRAEYVGKNSIGRRTAATGDRAEYERQNSMGRRAAAMSDRAEYDRQNFNGRRAAAMGDRAADERQNFNGSAMERHRQHEFLASRQYNDQHRRDISRERHQLDHSRGRRGSVSDNSDDSYHGRRQQQHPDRSYFAPSEAPEQQRFQRQKQRMGGNMQIEISPGVFAQLRGAEETWMAVEHGDVMFTDCMCCELHLMCIADADFVICPQCQVLCPVGLNGGGGGGGGGGVGLGLRANDYNGGLRVRRQPVHHQRQYDAPPPENNQRIGDLYSQQQQFCDVRGRQQGRYQDNHQQGGRVGRYY